jgi:alkylation response protein AidB-like acyl-CoA dehydrogenase
LLSEKPEHPNPISISFVERAHTTFRLNFDFSEEQLALKDEARKFLAAKCPPDRVRKLMDEDSPGFDPELWAQVAEQGWLGAAIPEEHGGLGLGYLELCCIAEELGRAVAPVPFASTVYFFAEALLRAGSAEQKAKYLPQVVTGELIGTIASAEQAGAVSAANISAEVSGGKLTGVKLPVTDGAVAHHAVVLAKEGGKPTLYLVDLYGPGVTREAVNTIDRRAKRRESNSRMRRLSGWAKWAMASRCLKPLTTARRC